MTTTTGASTSCPYSARKAAMAALSCSSMRSGMSPRFIGQKYAAGMPALDPLAAFRLDGNVAIVTGASAVLGARFARVLDAVGARVVLAARRAERIEALAGELTDAHAVPCDLTERGAPARLVAATLERYGQFDVVVNNAGMSEPTRAFEETTDKFERTLAINLVAPFELAREAARTMV